MQINGKKLTSIWKTFLTLWPYMNNEHSIQSKTKSEMFRLVPVREYSDERGTLGVAEEKDHTLPFAVKRVFWIYGVPEGKMRGGHAHHTCAEILVPLCGSFTAHLDNGECTADFHLSRPDVGIYIPRMTWCSFSDFSTDCICLCLASEEYKAEGYINRHDDFMREVKNAAQKLHF